MKQLCISKHGKFYKKKLAYVGFDRASLQAKPTNLTSQGVPGTLTLAH